VIRKLDLNLLLVVLLLLPVAACVKTTKAETGQSPDTGPHPTQVEPEMDADHFRVKNPAAFECSTSIAYLGAPQLRVTGVVGPDVSKQVPVVSLASGRILEIDARLGDTVRKGELLFKVQSSDISQAYSDYRKAVSNVQLSKIQLDRARLLFDHGAAPRSSVESAENSEANAMVDIETAREHLRILGSDPEHPTAVVPIYAPVSGVITDQQITAAAGIQALSAPNPLTISDVSRLWILCDVYENDLPQVRLGQYADIRLSAYPDLNLKGRVGNIGEILDPAVRSAKVRLEVENNGVLRLGMFATAVFHGLKNEQHVAVPASAILHLRDRDWVYTPTGSGMFRRLEVVAGNMLPDNMQEIASGITAGTRVVKDALVFQNTVEQ
jgi:membrane fusion protein, heavy metal efflux system